VNAASQSLRLVGLPDAMAANVRDILHGAMLAAQMFWPSQGLAGTMRIKS
jgi:hypothetical protein